MPQESSEGICSYLGRSCAVERHCKKSAEAIVAKGNELLIEIAEVSQIDEGLNIILYPQFV